MARKKVAGTKHASGVKKARREINVTMSPSPAGAEIRRTSGSSARMSLPNALRRGKSSRTNPRTMENAHLRLSRQLVRAFFTLIGVPIPVYSFSAVSVPSHSHSHSHSQSPSNPQSCSHSQFHSHSHSHYPRLRCTLLQCRSGSSSSTLYLRQE